MTLCELISHLFNLPFLSDYCINIICRANIEVQVKQQAAAPVSSEARLPEIVSGLDEDDDFGTSSGGGRSANNSNTAGKSATAEDLDELEGTSATY